MNAPYRLILPFLALAGGTAQAQTIVTSPAPERVAVTVYRNPQRPPARSCIGNGPIESMPTLRTRNRAERGLGLPLPAGGVTLFRTYRGRQLLVGDGETGDRAVGELVEVNFPAPPSLNAAVEPLMQGRRQAGWRLVVRNAADHPIDYEALLPDLDESVRFSGRVRRENGRWIWRTRVPANGTAGIEWGEGVARPIRPASRQAPRRGSP